MPVADEVVRRPAKETRVIHVAGSATAVTVWAPRCFASQLGRVYVVDAVVHDIGVRSGLRVDGSTAVGRRGIRRLPFAVAQENGRGPIRIFELNIKLNPNSANTYDSLGEAYMAAGDKAQAVKNYEKSLSLNPQNANATAMLKKLHEM